MATPDDSGDGASFVAPTMLEFKLLEQSAEATTGTFSGYLAAYGNTDENDDRLMPGAFTASLAEYRRAGEMPPMFLNHAGIPWDAVTTESLLPIGVWTDITEDSRGLVAASGAMDGAIAKGAEGLRAVTAGPPCPPVRPRQWGAATH